MKLKSAFILLAFGLVACNAADDELESRWVITHNLMDPGDGSGTFQPVTTGKTLEFYEDGTITSTGDLCTMSTAITSGSSGTYTETPNVIEPDDCDFGNFPITYTTDLDTMVLSFPCIEPCKEKYLRVD